MSTPSLHSILNAAPHAPRWELEYHGLRLTASESDDAGTLACILDHLLPILDQVARNAAGIRAAPAQEASPTTLHVHSLPAVPSGQSLTPDNQVVPDTRIATLVAPGATASASVEADDLPHDLRGLADIHLKQYQREGECETTAQTVGICLDLFISVVGNKASKQVNVRDMENFLDALSTWPKNRQFIADVDTMTPAELVDHARQNRLPSIGIGTQEKYVQHLSAFFNRLMKWKRCDQNPVLLINRRKRFGSQRTHVKRSFNNPEWQRPFNKDEMAKANAPWKFFGHLIPAFTGTRSNEIGQLKRSDVRVERMPDRDGTIHEILCLHIGHGKKRKSSNAVRVVPVPRRLMELGFEQYLQDLDAAGATDLFPGLRESEGRPGATIEDWFNGKLRTTWGIMDPKVTFHCFRHTIATLMRNARTPASIRRALMGHSSKSRPGVIPDGDSVAENHYEDEITPLDILIELDRLPFPELDVAPYERGMFNHYLKCEGVRRRSNDIRVANGESAKPKRGPKPKQKTKATQG